MRKESTAILIEGITLRFGPCEKSQTIGQDTAWAEGRLEEMRKSYIAPLLGRPGGTITAILFAFFCTR
jgi:hypothetical protein